MTKRLIVGDIVRITSQGIVAVGPVRSSYCETVYEDEFKRIGEEVAGIEMYDIMRHPDRVSYRYWKALDRGKHKVEVWESEHPGKWVTIYPRTIGGWTYEERRQAAKQD